MGWEHEAETVWRAQELYCHDRLSFDAVAAETGVAASTLKRWSEKYGWREKREEMAQLQAEIRADKVKARSVTLKALLKAPRADTAFAVAALENLTLKEMEAARQGKLRETAAQAPPLRIATPEDAVNALHTAIEQGLYALLTRPENVNLKSITEIGKCIDLTTELQGKYGVKEESGKAEGFSAETVERIKRQILGIRG